MKYSELTKGKVSEVKTNWSKFKDALASHGEVIPVLSLSTTALVMGEHTHKDVIPLCNVGIVCISATLFKEFLFLAGRSTLTLKEKAATSMINFAAFFASAGMVLAGYVETGAVIAMACLPSLYYLGNRISDNSGSTESH